VRYETYNPVLAVVYGTAKTWDMTVLTAKGLWKLVTMELPLSNLVGRSRSRRKASGSAGRAALAGALHRVISVNLAVLNLLPVPMLDAAIYCSSSSRVSWAGRWSLKEARGGPAARARSSCSS